MVVHHVEMDPVRAGREHGIHFLPQFCEIGGQNGWANDGLFAHCRRSCTEPSMVRGAGPAVHGRSLGGARCHSRHLAPNPASPITSKWIQSAPAASTASTSSPSRAKSAERIEGQMMQDCVAMACCCRSPLAGDFDG